MTSAWRIRGAVTLGLAMALAATIGLRDTRGDDAAAPAAAKATPRNVDLFDGMKSGDLDVKFIPRNANDGTILVKNNTDQPLTVKLPDAFAAVPVLAQAAAGAGGARQRNTGGGQNQALGGGGGLGGGLGGGRQGGGGAFDVAPEKVAKVKVATVCLEHGKKEPNANVPYELRPIESYTSDAKVQELCKLLGTGELSQRSAQAAAWHFANHMTWEELTNKKIHHLIGGDEAYFTPAEIHDAIKIADRAMKLADARTAGSTPSANTPSSN
jgi:hypothetical protein